MKILVLLFSMLTGLLLEPGKAAVVSMSVAGQPDSALRTGDRDRLFDFDGDGRNELRFQAIGLGTSTVSVQAVSAAYADVRIFNDRGAAILGLGEIIDVNAALYPGTHEIVHSWGSGGNGQLMSYFQSAGTGGPWNGRDGYLAFRFLDPASNIHYGWMHIKDSGGSIAFLEWAYETEDAKPIYAGQIPEPTTISFLLFAAFTLRRRR